MEEYARKVHAGFRKGTQVPYLAHLLGVASIVLGETGYVPFTVTEDMAIAALLHDAVEDEGGLDRLRDIEAKFGKDVAKIVEGCTDSLMKKTLAENQEMGRSAPEVLHRTDFRSEPRETLLVSAARTNCTTHAQLSRITEELDRQYADAIQERAQTATLVF